MQCYARTTSRHVDSNSPARSENFKILKEIKTANATKTDRTPCHCNFIGNTIFARVEPLTIESDQMQFYILHSKLKFYSAKYSRTGSIYTTNNGVASASICLPCMDCRELSDCGTRVARSQIRHVSHL